MSGKHGRRERVDRLIYRRKYGYEVIAIGGPGRRETKQFPPDASLDQMRAWRDGTAARLREEARLAGRLPAVDPSLLPRSESGWCYVYFVQSGGRVKIGRAVDVPRRLEALRTSSPAPMQLLAAVPAHAALEAAIHERFGRLREQGEWFRLDEELISFIEQLNANANPVALLMAPTTTSVQR